MSYTNTEANGGCLEVKTYNKQISLLGTNRYYKCYMNRCI